MFFFEKLRKNCKIRDENLLNLSGRSGAKVRPLQGQGVLWVSLRGLPVSFVVAALGRAAGALVLSFTALRPPRGIGTLSLFPSPGTGQRRA